jgi:hypothetical protein
MKQIVAIDVKLIVATGLPPNAAINRMAGIEH